MDLLIYGALGKICLFLFAYLMNVYMGLKKTIYISVVLLFIQGIVLAQENNELSELRHKAAKVKDLDAYCEVCKYLYEMGSGADLLLIYADSIRQLAIRDKSLDCFLESYNWSSEAYFMKGDFSKGFSLKYKTLVLAENARRIGDALILCSDIGYYYNVCARYDSARYYFNKGMQLAEKTPLLADRYRTMLTNYASSYLFEGKMDSALVYTLQAKERSAADKDTAMLIENLNQLGTIYRRKKDLEQCIASFESALHLCEAQNNFRTAAYIYGNIATAYCDWKRPKDAIPFSEKAMEYALKLGNHQMIGVCYVNLGAIMCNISGRREEGIAVLQKAIPILEEVNNRRRLCEVYSYLINAYRQNGQQKAAMDYLGKLDKLAHELKTDVEHYRYYKSKAPLLQMGGRYAEATDYYLRMINMLENGYRDPMDYEHYMRLAECYRALRKDAAAYDCLYKAYALRDSSFHFEYTEQLSDYSVKYHTKEKELEIIRLRKNELEREAELLKRRIIFGSVLALLVIVMLFMLYIRLRQQVRIARLAKIASEKEQQFLVLQKDTEQRLTRKYIDGLESERQRMATELHDDVCNSLLALEMNVCSLPEVKDGRMDGQLKQLETIRQRLRNMSHELMPPAFQYATIDEMLSDYVLHLTLPEGMKAEYSSTEGVDWHKIPQKVGFEFYRIVQEAVSNALKYSAASCIRVRLEWQDGLLSVLIADDGRGFEPNKKTNGVGLRTLLQRADAVGAKVELDSGIGNGVQVKVTVLV